MLTRPQVVGREVVLTRPPGGGGGVNSSPRVVGGGKVTASLGWLICPEGIVTLSCMNLLSGSYHCISIMPLVCEVARYL